MIRILMVAMLASASIYAVDEPSSTDFSLAASKNCNRCKRGPMGPQGVNGQNGADGPAGPPGPAGLSTPDIVVAYTAASTPDFLAPINPPLLGQVIRVPFGGAPAGIPLLSNGPGAPQLVQTPGQNHAYCVSQDLVIVSMAATFTLENFLDTPTPGTEITPRMEIWVAPFGSEIFTPSGAGVNFPTLVVPANPSDLDNTTLNVTPTPLSVLIPTGSRIIMICSFTATENIRLFAVSTAGISMSYP